MKHVGEFWIKFCKNIWLEKYVYSDSLITVGAKIRNLARLVPRPEFATGCRNPFQRPAGIIDPGNSREN